MKSLALIVTFSLRICFSSAASVPTSVARARQQQEDAQKNKDNNTCSESDTAPPIVECGIFMAPSTLGDESNLGIFTAIALAEGEVVPHPEIAIPMFWRNFDKDPPNSLGDGTLWDRYLWGGYVADLDPISDLDRGDSRSVFVSGVGCTINSMLDMANIESTQGSTYDTAFVERHHPAAGSFTPYHNSQTVAIKDIPLGSELLANYGDGWIPKIPDVAVTFEKHLDRGDDFSKSYTKWISYIKLQYGEQVNDSLLKRLWKLTTTLGKPSPDFSVLPKEWQHVDQSTRDYWRSQTKRSIEWLQEHGKCQDHLRSDISTIPNAGRGAFATRHLPKGTEVGYAPLVHIGEAGSSLLQFTYPDKRTKPDIIWNYSFGHRNSTLILTPYGAGVNYINHSSRDPNVRIQWPSDELVAHKPNWLRKDVGYLRETTGKVGLSFDYIALRDIAEGEEIFMDYGEDWERAWEHHMETYEAPVDADDYQHSSNYHIDYLKTPSELESSPYPSNLHTLCKLSYRKNTEDGKFYFMSILRPDNHHVYCEVLERFDDKDYTVEMTIPDTGEKIVVHQVTSPEGIGLFDKAFSQDMHLLQSFRHIMHIPDDMFPKTWKNKL
jgi:hypothetical protein